MAAKVYVHYYVNAVHGVVTLHFSGSQSRANVFAKDKTIFGLALIGVQQIPSKDKLWEPSTKTWNIHADVWSTLLPYYSTAPEIYGLVPYSTKAQWDAFITGKVATRSESNGSYSTPVSEAEAAQQFFGQQAFNHAVYHTATELSDREEFISLLGLNKWGEFDSLPAKQAKKLYLSAAMRLHPDRNNGDGSKMSKLNELWGIYGSR